MEAFEVIKKDNYLGINPRSLLQAAKHENSNCNIDDLISYLLNVRIIKNDSNNILFKNGKKQKSEKKEGIIFNEDIIAVINEFQIKSLDK